MTDLVACRRAVQYCEAGQGMFGKKNRNFHYLSLNVCCYEQYCQENPTQGLLGCLKGLSISGTLHAPIICLSGYGGKGQHNCDGYCTCLGTFCLQ